ncbi:MAG: hypothetical protein ACRYGK_02250 [Janthinobacterium lividum]
MPGQKTFKRQMQDVIVICRHVASDEFKFPLLQMIEKLFVGAACLSQVRRYVAGQLPAFVQLGLARLRGVKT